MVTTLKITGRIRDHDNREVQGYSVTGYIEHKNLKPSVETVKTDPEGSFEMVVSVPDDYRHDEAIRLSLQVKDAQDRIVIDTPSRGNSTGRVDFQIKLSSSPDNREESDIYEGGFDRLISAYSRLGDGIDSSRSDIRQSVDSLVGVVKGWKKFRDELALACGLEVIQVPKRPRRERHSHVSRWDEVELPW